jgi:hypothetical protein
MKKAYLFLLAFIAATIFMVSSLTSFASADLVQDAQCTGANCVPQCSDSAATGNTSNSCDPASQACSKSNCDLVAKYVNPLILLLTICVGLAVTVGIIWGGIEYASSAGDPQKSASGRRHITMAIIALLGYFFIYGAIKFLFPGAG